MTTTKAAERSMERLRAALVAARDRAGLTADALSRRCKCSRSTVRNLEDGTANSRIDTAVIYAQAVGLDIAAVPAHLAHLLDLGADDAVAVLRAAQAAAEGHRLNPLQSRHVLEVLTKLRTPAAP